MWDPSGTRVFYAVDLPPFQIFEVETSGAAEPKRVLEGTVDQIPRAVSPDGRWIYLARTPDLLRPREVRVVTDWAAEVESLFARGGGN